jgi:hypothetical protein
VQQIVEKTILMENNNEWRAKKKNV